MDDVTTKNPSDYVIGSGEQHSVKEFLTIAFNHVGLNYNDYLKIDENFFRPAEVETLLADPAKARKNLHGLLRQTLMN